MWAKVSHLAGAMTVVRLAGAMTVASLAGAMTVARLAETLTERHRSLAVMLVFATYY